MLGRKHARKLTGRKRKGVKELRWKLGVQWKSLIFEEWMNNWDGKLGISQRSNMGGTKRFTILFTIVDITSYDCNNIIFTCFKPGNLYSQCY